MATTSSDSLASTVCVLRAKAPQVLALDHVVELVDALQDGSVLSTLDKAAASGSMRWFDRIYERILPVQPLYDGEIDYGYGSRDDCIFEYQLGKAMEAAVANGHLEIVQKIHTLHPKKVFSGRVFSIAAGNGDLRMFQWLLENRTDGFCRSDAGHPLQFCCLGDAYESALDNNHLHIIKWLLENRFNRYLFDKKAGDTAASVGDLDLVKWLHPKKMPECFTIKAIDEAAKGGHLEVVQFLLANRTEGFTSAAVHYAIVGGFTEIEQVLDSSSQRPNEDLQALGKFGPEAAALGRLDLLQSDDRYVMKTTSVQQHALVRACTSGHLEVVQWLMDQYKIQWDAAAVAGAARQGHVHVLEWILQFQASGACWTVSAMDVAAKNGQLTTVQWLHTNRTEGCTIMAMDSAAANGHFEVAQWLHENRTEGCTAEAMDEAARNGHINMVQWLHENRSEGCTTQAMDAAATNGHLEVVQWLHQNRTEGCTTDAMDHAARNGHMEMVMWLHEHRTEGCTTDAMDYAPYSILRWLHFHRTEGCTTQAMDEAAKRGDLATCDFLQCNRTEGCSYNAAEGPFNTGHSNLVWWLELGYPEQFDRDMGETNPHCIGMCDYDEWFNCG